MKIVLLFLCGLLTVLQAFPSPVVYTKDNVGIDYDDCSSSEAKDRATLESLDISPNPAVSGQDVTVDAGFILKEQVDSGKIKFTARLIGIPVLNEEISLCETEGVECPLKEGQHKISAKIPIRGEAIQTTYKVNVEITNQSDQELGCLNFDLRVVKP